MFKTFLDNKPKEFYNNIELTNLIGQLIKENHELRGRVEKLERREKKAVKRDIYAFLKEEKNKKDVIFSKWKTSFVVNREGFEELLENSLSECIQKQISKNIGGLIQDQRKTHYPFYACSEKKNIVYVFDNTEWRKIEREDIRSIISNIEFAFSRAFNEWYKEKESLFDSSKKMCELKQEYTSKLSDSKIFSDQRNTELTKVIYELVKESLT